MSPDARWRKRDSQVLFADGPYERIHLTVDQAIHVVLDIVHVIEKLWAASRCFHTATDPDAACRYLENNAACLHYDKALAAGWPIARGIVEGAARHLMADRLDITSSGWTVPGAEAVLTLRALISNGDFPQYWIFHTHRERERLSPGPTSTPTNSWPDRRPHSRSRTQLLHLRRAHRQACARPVIYRPVEVRPPG
ncbi:hypothetical protein QQY66_00755 [Streptomyces sp. DG2A-72]|uniref:hypothetical protein n=1 Tax=Streptomyces sp. DG2A-72 TaxID=3051386 RepID=UPI00265B7362|nr:hypothetical protein [Streptomyces sp. DG2A-72]MDO0930311.1 hypothetical protein [Streptomyces sp. DG2A-72]